jgi:hypothetical protein
MSATIPLLMSISLLKIFLTTAKYQRQLSVFPAILNLKHAKSLKKLEDLTISAQFKIQIYKHIWLIGSTIRFSPAHKKSASSFIQIKSIRSKYSDHLTKKNPM